MNEPGTLELLLPLILVSIPWAIAVGLLAKDKERNVALWVVLTLIPFFGFFAVIYIVGVSNLRIERKLDEVLAKLDG